MAYEFALPLHISGLTLTSISNILLPAGWPLSLEFFLLTSNPGSIDAASKHWDEAAKKIDEFKAKLDHAQTLSNDYWSGDDQKQVKVQMEKFKNELDKLRTGIHRGHLIVEILAIIFLVVCILVFSVGIFLFALFILAWSALYIPIIGEAIIAELNGVVGTLEGAITPSLAKTKLAIAEASGIVAYIGSALISSIDFEILTGGAKDPNFTQVVAPTLQPPPV